MSTTIIPIFLLRTNWRQKRVREEGSVQVASCLPVRLSKLLFLTLLLFEGLLEQVMKLEVNDRSKEERQE